MSQDIVMRAGSPVDVSLDAATGTLKVSGSSFGPDGTRFELGVFFPSPVSKEVLRAFRKLLENVDPETLPEPKAPDVH